ncbi:Charged multivesicular body protein 6 [Phytophthora boehmeriae]|uniref:Charged multivesicular body protein 6 n=1 Tax=Phytophthora boehmeriae TaxID=109152 RepID=A0A8T1XCT5_9STRA|nr:Charged multivesicular body protein 6 [Phytophthora boehmeriae]
MGGSSSKSKQRSALNVTANGAGNSSARSQITSKDKAILDLKNARDRLKKYQSRLDIEANQLHGSAKRLLQAGKRDRAKLALKLKKYKEQQMQQADEHLIQVLGMLDTVEWETQQLQVFEGLKAGNSILNAIHKEMTVEAVEELMMETEEAQATANEISRIIGGSLTVEDEDAVLSELAEIEKLEAESIVAAMPEAPITEIETADVSMEVPTATPESGKSRTRAVQNKKEAVAILGSTECEFFTPWCDPSAFWLYLCMSLLLICAAGMMAGLTMGLLSLDMLNMRILEMEGSEEEKRYAKQVLPVLTKHHFLLVTLLIVNASANEALPIFLNKLVPEAVSILLSVTCVLFFGEIIPSAVFTGPNQLRIAAMLCPAVRVLMAITCPISYPVSRALDWWLGDDHDPAQYKRKEIKALVTLQRENDAARQNFMDHMRESKQLESTPTHSTPTKLSAIGERQTMLTPQTLYEDSAQGTKLHVDEVTIIHGALDLAAKTVAEVMIPMEDVYMLELDTELSPDMLARVLASGHSRIPVYEKHPSNIVGLLLVKKLIVVDPDDRRPIRDFILRKPILVGHNESCYAMLNEFQKGRSHIALVTKDVDLVARCWHEDLKIPESVVFEGIVTIEDVIEELIQEEIEDESDVYAHSIVDYWQKRYHKAAKGSSSAFVKKRLKLLADQRHHLLLVTFLVVNATANEALPIFLDKLVPEGVSIILSVTCVLMFGEIIPAAFFTGPNQLKVAAALCPLVRVLMAVVFPIAYPIIKLLDWWLGADHDAAQYKRNELKALVALQRESEALRQSYVESIKYDYESESCHSSTSSCASVLMSPKTLRKQPLLKPEPEAEVAIEIQVEIPDQHKRRHQRKAKDTRLNVDEVTIIHGALDLSSKTVTEVMIAMSEVFMLEIDTKLDRNTMADILASGHSRIPVYETRKSNIVGLLLVKKLIVLDPDDAHPIRDLVLLTKDAELVSECWHSNQPIPPHVLFEGIVTIEDVIEELIQEKIEDESGVYVHDIVDYWNTKSQQSRLQAVAAKAFITKKLETLAERARLRVRDRRLHAATQINVNDESAKKKLSP